MAKAICVHCKSILDISDDIVECTACGAVIRVVDRNPLKLKLLEPGSINDEADTPRAQPDNYKYSTGGSRFVAGFVDGLVLLPIGMMDGWIIRPDSSATLLAGWLIISYSAAWAYSVLMHSRYGQTVGKMLCNVKVLDISEQPITIRQAFLRDSVIIIINIASLMVSLYIVIAGDEANFPRLESIQLLIAAAAMAWGIAEVLTLLTNKKRRALHDFIAGTVVVRVNS